MSEGDLNVQVRVETLLDPTTGLRFLLMTTRRGDELTQTMELDPVAAERQKILAKPILYITERKPVVSHVALNPQSPWMPAENRDVTHAISFHTDGSSACSCGETGCRFLFQARLDDLSSRGKDISQLYRFDDEQKRIMDAAKAKLRVERPKRRFDLREDEKDSG